MSRTLGLRAALGVPPSDSLEQLLRTTTYLRMLLLINKLIWVYHNSVLCPLPASTAVLLQQPPHHGRVKEYMGQFLQKAVRGTPPTNYPYQLSMRGVVGWICCDAESCFGLRIWSFFFLNPSPHGLKPVACLCLGRPLPRLHLWLPPVLIETEPPHTRVQTHGGRCVLLLLLAHQGFTSEGSTWRRGDDSHAFAKG